MLEMIAQEERPNVEEIERNLDYMSYEQILAVQEQAGGNVNRGFFDMEINLMESVKWDIGMTESDSCPLCLENFVVGRTVKTLKCACRDGAYYFCAVCIDGALSNDKRCPLCQTIPYLW